MGTTQRVNVKIEGEPRNLVDYVHDFAILERDFPPGQWKRIRTRTFTKGGKFYRYYVLERKALRKQQGKS